MRSEAPQPAQGGPPSAEPEAHLRGNLVSGKPEGGAKPRISREGMPTTHSALSQVTSPRLIDEKTDSKRRGLLPGVT